MAIGAGLRRGLAALLSCSRLLDARGALTLRDPASGKTLGASGSVRKPRNEERRRATRRRLQRPARLLLLGRAGYVDVRTENVSRHGLAVSVAGKVPSALLSPGTLVEVEVCAADGSPMFLREAAIRHVTGGTIGVEVCETVPLELVDLSSHPIAAPNPGLG